MTYRRQQLGRANAAVVVAVDERQGFFIQFESLDRARKGDPEFLIELFEGQEIGARGEGYLIESASAVERPIMSCIWSGGHDDGRQVQI